MGKRKLKGRFLAVFLAFATAFTSANFGSIGSVTVFAKEAAALAAGDYYIQNTATGRFLNGGNSWGTQASALSYGQLMTLNVVDGAAGTYNIDSHIANNEDNHFLGDNAFVDGAAAPMTIAACGNGSFTIAKSDGQYLTASNENTVVAFGAEKTDLSEWRFLTREELISEAVENATEGSPVDVTSLVLDAGLSRNNQYQNKWSGGIEKSLGSGVEIKGENAARICVEKYCAAFDSAQTIENVPNGVYELRVQGFYRKDKDPQDPAVYYINETEQPLMTIDADARDAKVDNAWSTQRGDVYVPNSMNDSSNCFVADGYTNEFITATVTDHTLKIGVKAAAANNWVIWDNFTLRLKSAEEGSEDYVGSLFQKRFDKEQGILGSNLGYRRIRTDLSLAKTVNAMHGSVVEWYSTEPNIISDDGKIQEGAKNGDGAMMTAKVKESADAVNDLYTWYYPVRIAKAVEVQENGKVYNLNGNSDDIMEGMATLSGETWALKDGEGIIYRDGKSGEPEDKSMYLDGTCGLEMPHYNLDAENGGWSVSLWYNPVEITNNSAVLFVGYGDREKEKWLGVAGDGTDGLKVWWNDKTEGASSAALMQSGLSKIKPEIGKWNMLTLTQSAVSGETSTVKAYVDGELYATMTHKRSFLEGEDQTIYLGTNFWDASFKTLIDDVSVYKKELTAAEVGQSFLSSLREEELKSKLNTFLRGKMLGENESFDKVTKDLTLPSSYLGQQITWTNSNDKALALADGTATVANTDGILPESTTLTYTYAYNGGITGTLEVKAGTEASFVAEEFFGKEQSEQDAYVKEEIEKAMLNGNPSLNQVSTDLTMLQTVSFKGLDVASVIWASSDEAINVTETPGTGKVVYEDSVSKEVTLTATVTYIDDTEHKGTIAIEVKVAKPVISNPIDMGNCQNDAAGKGKTDTTMEVGVTSANANGSEYCAPKINNVSIMQGSGDLSNVGYNRIGFLVFQVADLVKGSNAQDKDLADFDVDTLEYATLQMNVESVNGNLNGWKMKVGLYPVKADAVDSIVNTNQATYPAVDDAYDKDHVTWCQEWLSKDDKNVTIHFDIKNLVKEAITNGQEKIAFRLQVPASQVIVTGLGNTNESLRPATVVQLRRVLTADEKAQADAKTLADSVSVPAKLNEDSALTLPTAIGEFRSNVTWISDNPAIALTKDDEANVYRVAVTRPKEEDATVTLTASVKNGEGTAVEKTFGVTVEKFMEIAEFDGELLADFSFDDAETGLAGKQAKASVYGDNSRYEDGKFGKALYLGSQTWLDVTKDDAEKTALLKGKEEITVSYYSKSNFDNTSGGSWTFFAARNGENFNSNNGRHYLAVLDAKNAVKVERYEANSGHNFKQEELANEWRKVDLVASAEKTVLYIDGQKVKETSSVDDVQALSTILGESGGVLYIGKATWGSGEYYDGLLDEYKIYDRALTSEEVGRLYQRDQELLAADAKLAAAKDALSKPTIGENDTITFVTEDADNGCTIAWSVPENDSVVIAADGKTAKVTRSQEDVYVTLTATITYKTDLVEKTDTKVFEIHVPKTGGKTDAELAAERVAAVKAALWAPVIGDDDTITFVTENTEYNCTITWSAPKDSAIKIAADGKTATVVRGDTESEVTLTATIRGKVLTTVSDTKTFTITIPAIEVDEDTKAARSQLAKAVADARVKFDGTKAEDYPDGIWQALSDAIGEADEASKTGTVAIITAANTKLEDALKNFKTKAEIADEAAKAQEAAAKERAVSDLTAWINTKKPTGSQNDYTPESWAAYQKALADAQAILKDANATSVQINAAKAALEKAFQELDPRKDPQPEPPASVTKVSSIKFTAKTYQIAAGKKIDLNKVMTVLPKNATNKKVNFATTKTGAKYITLKNGVVTTKKAGKGKTVSITATAADGSGKKATVKIKIMKNAVTKLTVKKKSLTVKAGKKVAIKATVKTDGKNVNKKLEYTSSNTKYATVNSKGVVSTKKAGKGKTVTITVKTTDGSNKSVKVKVKIKK